jgi:hypothetical protein
MNLMQLERAQKDIVCSIYCDLFIWPNIQKKMLIVQSVQCHVAAECIGRMTIQLTCQSTWH